MTEQNMKPAILLESSNGSTYYHIKGRLVLADVDKYGNVAKVRNASDEWFYDLELRAQGDMGNADTDIAERVKLYGWGLSFSECHFLELNKLRKMTRGLGTVERRLAKLAETEGPCDSFWQYVNRVRRALRATIIVRENGDAQDYDNNEYRSVAPLDLPIKIRQLQERVFKA